MLKGSIMIGLNRTLNGLMLFFVLQVIFFSFYFFENREIKIPREIKEESSLHALKIWGKVAPQLHNINYTPPEKESKSPFSVVSPQKGEDILAPHKQKVQPVLYTNSIPLSTLSIEEKKKTFINIMLPSILLAKYKVKLERNKLLKLSDKKKLTEEDRTWLKEKRSQYKAKDYVALYKAMELHPTSLIIAQAIVESGWGTSKFFQKANNVFGVWSFSDKDNRIVAGKKRGDKHVYLKKYETLVESIHDYFLTVSRNVNYEKFREKRLITQDPFVLVNYLDKYSELGEEYIKNIKNIIKINKLLVYDDYQLAL